MCVQGFMKFRPRGFKILRKQSVTDGWTETRTDGQRENSIPPYGFIIAGGGGGGGGGGYDDLGLL